MWTSIDITKLNRMLKLYNNSDKMKFKNFEKFVESHEDDLDITDSVGVVTKGDFENNFDKDFIEENFDDLAYAWFRGLSGQADFGILGDVIKEEFEEEVRNHEDYKSRMHESAVRLGGVKE